MLNSWYTQKRNCIPYIDILYTLSNQEKHTEMLKKCILPFSVAGIIPFCDTGDIERVLEVIGPLQKSCP